MKNLDYVKGAVEAAVTQWREEVIRAGKPIRGIGILGFSPKFFPVPLASKDSIAGHSVATILACMYDTDASDDDIVKAWDGIVVGLRTPQTNQAISLSRKAASTLFKNFRFPVDHPFSVAVQFLKLVSLVRGYRLSVSRLQATLFLPSGDRLGIDRFCIFSPGETFRTRRNVQNLRATLKESRSHRLPLADLRVREAYRLFSEILPERSSEIDLVFSIALEGGKQLYPELYKGLDITVERSLKHDPYVVDSYSEARRLVFESTRNPRKSLADLLIPLIGAKKFVRLFGSPYAATLPPYSQTERTKYRRGIDLLTAEASPEVETQGEEQEANPRSNTVGDAAQGLLNSMFGV